MLENDKLNPEELQSPKLATLPVDTEELEAEEKIMEGVDEELQKELQEAEDLDKRNYTKITPTFYIQPIETEDVDDEGNKIDLFQILNPKTGVVEKRELTDDEKHEILVLQLKESRIKFRSTRHAVKTVGTSTVVSSIGRERQVKEKAVQTNLTINQFGAAYKQKRKRRNKLAKASRKNNR
jgi:hypothetical protein